MHQLAAAKRGVTEDGSHSMGCAESPIQAAAGVALLEALFALGAFHELYCKEDSCCLSAHAVQSDLATGGCRLGTATQP